MAISRFIAYVPHITTRFIDSFNQSPAGVTFMMGLPLILGYLAGSHVRRFKDEYHKLEKPLIELPNILFKYVWSFMYGLMGFSSYLILSTVKNAQDPVILKTGLIGLGFYGLQLAVNLCIPAIMFRYKLFLVSLIAITANLILICANIAFFDILDEDSAILLFPYLIWTAATGYICKNIWRKNQHLDMSFKNKKAE